MNVLEVPSYMFQNHDMNTTTQNAVTMLPHNQIGPSPTNPRKKFDPEKLKELASTIKQHGVLEPLLVRDRKPGWFNETVKGERRYEIIAGERRWRASELAGLQEVPCIVKELTDAEVLEIQYIENLQREDLSAIEEAEGFAKLIETKAYTAETLAKKLGKSRSHVFSRLKLCKLTGPVREALDAGELAPTVAEIVARVPSPFQKQALSKVLKGEYGNGSPMSKREAAEFVEREYTANLEEAIWQMNDKKLLPAAGSCDVCPHRSGNCREEYPDIKSENICTKLDCFQEKKQAHRARLLAEESKRGKVLTLAECDKIYDRWGQLGWDSDWTELDRFGVRTRKSDLVIQYVQFSEVLKKPKSECYAAVTPDGEIERLYRKKDLEAEMVAAGVKPLKEDQEAPQASKETPEEKAKREAKEKLDREIEKASLEQTAAAVLAKIFNNEGALWKLILHSLWEADLNEAVAKRHGLDEKLFRDWPALSKAVEKWHPTKLRVLVIDQILCGYSYGDDGYQASTVELAAGLLKIDDKAIRKKVSEELKAKAKAEAEKLKGNSLAPRGEPARLTAVSRARMAAAGQGRARA